MPPLRRYLRITQHSVLEVRIYLDQPSDLHRWLLNPTSTALPRIIAAVRPLVLPKLQEETTAAAQARSKGGKKAKGWKDTVAGDDFEVGVFLTQGGCRHAILRRERRVKGEGEGRLGKRGGGKMTGGSMEVPVDVEEAGETGLRRDGSEDEGVTLADIPAAGSDEGGSDGLFVSDDEGGEERAGGNAKKPAGKQDVNDGDNKKKLGFTTDYDGFSIYGRILCLVVKRKGTTKEKERSQGAGQGQARMEEWISSTQVGGEGLMAD